jgi:hypothetical protein
MRGFSIDGRAGQGSGAGLTAVGRMVAGLLRVARRPQGARSAVDLGGESRSVLTWPGWREGGASGAGAAHPGQTVLRPAGLASSLELAQTAAARLSAEADRLAELAAALGEDCAEAVDLVRFWGAAESDAILAHQALWSARAGRTAEAAVHLAGEARQLRQDAEAMLGVAAFYQDGEL